MAKSRLRPKRKSYQKPAAPKKPKGSQTSHKPPRLDFETDSAPALARRRDEEELMDYEKAQGFDLKENQEKESSPRGKPFEMEEATQAESETVENDFADLQKQKEFSKDLTRTAEGEGPEAPPEPGFHPEE
ncbi:MAG: hypothetical protein H6581_00500 [Bacteroidia bacterium]|nr:hypothetical protein [Bacteroidia bacterium]